MPYIIKHIFDDIKLILDYNLITNPPQNFKYELSIFYNILQFIESSIKKSNDEYIRISRENFSKYLNINERTFDKYITYLISKNILFRTSYYNESDDNRISYGYKIANEVNISKFTKFVYKSMINKIITQKEIDLSDEAVRITYENLQDLKIDLNASLKTLYIANINGDIKDNSAKITANNIYDILQKSFYVSKGKNSNRIYSNFTNISKLIKNHIYLDDKLLSEVDAKSSQLYILSNLTKHIKSYFHWIIYNDDFYTWMLDEVKERLKSDDYKNEYVVYDTEKQTIKHKIHYDYLTRKFIKEEVYKSLFSFFKGTSHVTMIFKENFSEIINEFNNILNNHNLNNKLELTPASYLQQIEANIFINAFIELNNSGIKCLTKHDSIHFFDYDLNAVIECLIRHYNKNGFSDIKQFLKITLSNEVKSNSLLDDNQFIGLTVIDIEDEFDKLKSQQKLIRFNFYNNVTHETFFGDRNSFVDKYNLNNESVKRLINNKLLKLNNWTISPKQ